MPISTKAYEDETLDLIKKENSTGLSEEYIMVYAAMHRATEGSQTMAGTVRHRIFNAHFSFCPSKRGLKALKPSQVY